MNDFLNIHSPLVICSTVVTVTIVPPMVRVPEDNGTVTICLEANTGIAANLEVDITVSEKPTPDASEHLCCLFGKTPNLRPYIQIRSKSEEQCVCL